MKKIRTLIIFSMLFCIFFNFSSLNIYAETRSMPKIIFSESSFEENNFNGWAPFGNNSKLSIEKKYSHKGSASLKTSERGAEWSGPSLNITSFLTPDEPAYISAFVICEPDKKGVVKMTVRYTDSQGTESYDTLCSVNTGSFKWENLNGEITLPESINDAVLYFETDSKEVEFYIDDVTIYGYGEKAEKAMKSKPEYEYSFGFEEGNEGWVHRGDLKIEVTDKFCYSGKKSLYASERNLVWNSPAVRLDNIQPGVNYTYSSYVMYNGKEYEDNHVFLIELQYSYEGEEHYSVIAEKELQKGTWSNISGDFTLPSGASDIYFYIQTIDVDDALADENDLMSFYIDNVNIVDSTLKNKRNTRNFILMCIAAAVLSAVMIYVVLKIYRKIRSTSSALRSATIDTMTKTFNRNAYEEKIREFEANPAKCKGVFITECDINFLKHINDNYGHECGDKAIVRCASVLLKIIGKKGTVYRTGGDEFMCITSKDFTEKLKNEFLLESANFDGYPFSAAVGTACYDPSVDKEPDIIVIAARCDEEMYKNKQEIKQQNTFF